MTSAPVAGIDLDLQQVACPARLDRRLEDDVVAWRSAPGRRRPHLRAICAGSGCPTGCWRCRTTPRSASARTRTCPAPITVACHRSSTATAPAAAPLGLIGLLGCVRSGQFLAARPDRRVRRVLRGGAAGVERAFRTERDRVEVDVLPPRHVAAARVFVVRPRIRGLDVLAGGSRHLVRVLVRRVVRTQVARPVVGGDVRQRVGNDDALPERLVPLRRRDAPSAAAPRGSPPDSPVVGAAGSGCRPRTTGSTERSRPGRRRES